MILEHEIPNGSRIYFTKSAKIKRNIENKIIDYLYNKKFEEIITPNFSYSQHQSLSNQNQIIKINDENNNLISLRADSTLDVVRIITKRLGRTTTHKKWFYSQPVFKYPSKEFYQIGIEWINHNKLADLINISADILNILELKPIIQLSHSQIPYIIADELKIEINDFDSIDKLLSLNCEWLNSLIRLENLEQIDTVINKVPEKLKQPLKDLQNEAKNINYDKIVITPTYTTKLKYYNGVNFRIFNENRVLAKGGSYETDNISSLGFAFYIDNLIEELI